MVCPNEKRMGMILPLALAVCCLCASGCTRENKPVEAKPRLLIFCGITMINPVKELMDLYEKQTGVKSVMSYGGSADLFNSVKENKTGDVYFPGAESFLDEARKAGIAGDSFRVGENRAVLVVRKGNPKGITGDLNELLRPGIAVAIGHPDLGSVGKEAFDILTRKGIYDKVVAASAMLLPDSKALSGVLREGKVDVVINWQSVLYVSDNAQHMESVPILGDYAKSQTLRMALIPYSKHPAEARKFLELCASPQGREVFAKHGF